MLPSLGALSLGAPTGAEDDVVTEIRDEQVEADKRAWEAWHEDQEMEEAEDAERQAMREQSLTAFSRAAAAADSSGDESYDEPLDRRGERLAPKSPPLYTLKQDPFDEIVNELVKRLAPDAKAIKNSDADAMCRDVANVCRELATLNRLPGLAVDPKYDCSDPNAEIWKYAHAIFGANPKKHVWLRDKERDQSWKQNFRDLCKAFDPKFDFAVVEWEAFHGGGIAIGDYLVWNKLWRMIPGNSEVAEAWEEKEARERARDAFDDRSREEVDSDEEGESDYDEDDAFESFFSEYDDPFTPRHCAKREELRRLRAKVRRPIKRGWAQIQWRIDNLPKLLDGLDLYYDHEKPDKRHVASDYFAELENKVRALKRLFRTLLNQARAMQAAAS
jgi:hypothetical protein